MTKLRMLLGALLLTAAFALPNDAAAQGAPPVPQSCQDFMLNWGGEYCASWTMTMVCVEPAPVGPIQHTESGWVGSVQSEQDVWDQLWAIESDIRQMFTECWFFEFSYNFWS